MKSSVLMCGLFVFVLLRPPAGSGVAPLNSGQNASGHQGTQKAYENRPPLQPAAMYLLPLTSIRPGAGSNGNYGFRRTD